MKANAAATVLALLTMLSLGLAAPAAAQDKHPTCQQTAARVLKPYQDRLDRAMQAVREYEAKDAERIRDIRRSIAVLSASRDVFRQAQADDLAALDRHYALMREAVEDIRADIQKRIVNARTEAATARAAGREREALDRDRQAENLIAQLASQTAVGFKPELNRKDSMAGWRRRAEETRRVRDARAAEWQGGDRVIFVPALNQRIAWNGVQGLIADERARLAAASRRDLVLHLRALNERHDGRSLDARVDTLLAELRAVRADIDKGTYTLPVPTFGMPRNRNQVQTVIDDARRKRAGDEAAWATGTYRANSRILGRPTSSGELRDTIVAEEAKLSAFIASGDKARVTVRELGYPTTGEALKLERQRAALDKKVYWATCYSLWRRAKAGEVAEWRRRIAWWRDVLRAFEDQWRKDLADQQAYIDTKLTWALGETPCGGAPVAVSAQDRVAGNADMLAGISETPQEQRCRLGRYGDHVFVTKTGALIGSQRDGLMAALSDTDLLKPARPVDIPAYVMAAKNALDAALGGKDSAVALAEVAWLQEYRREIDALVDKMKAVSIAKGADEVKASRQFLQDAATFLARNDVLSGDRIGRLKAVLKDERLAATLANGLADLGRMRQVMSLSVAEKLRAARAVTAENLTMAKALMQSNPGALGQSFSRMTGIDKALLAISVAAAVAETQAMVNDGKDPREAAFRAASNLAVDLVLSGIPITAAAEAGTQIVFNGLAAWTGDKAWSDATLSNIVKEEVVKATYDRVATISAFAGTEYASLVDKVRDGADIAATVDRDELVGALQRVQAQLNASAGRGTDEIAHLMRMRARLRQLIRAQDGLDCQAVLSAKKT